MPTINLKERKRKRIKTRAKVHAQSIYQDKRWKSLRQLIIYIEPMCRNCNENSRTTLATEVHHIIPFSSGSSPEQVEMLAFDGNNCEPLCADCHRLRHILMNK